MSASSSLKASYGKSPILTPPSRFIFMRQGIFGHLSNRANALVQLLPASPAVSLSPTSRLYQVSRLPPEIKSAVTRFISIIL